MTSDPLLDAVYGRAQHQENKRAEKQAKFDKSIADGVLDRDGVPTGKVKDDEQRS
jgi:hypothetical protein